MGPFYDGFILGLNHCNRKNGRQVTCGVVTGTPLHAMGVILFIVAFHHLLYINAELIHARPVVHQILFDCQTIRNRHTNFKAWLWTFI